MHPGLCTAPTPSKPMLRLLQEITGRWCHRSAVCLVLTIDVYAVSYVKFCNIGRPWVHDCSSFHLQSAKTKPAKVKTDNNQVEMMAATQNLKSSSHLVYFMLFYILNLYLLMEPSASQNQVSHLVYF